MLSFITLHTIKQIFDNDLEIKLSASEKMFYINCLMYHFEETEEYYRSLPIFVVVSLIEEDEFTIEESETKFEPYGE